MSDVSLLNAHLNGFVLTLGKSINAKWRERFFWFLNKHLVCMYMYSEKNTYSVYKYNSLTKEDKFEIHIQQLRYLCISVIEQDNFH